MTDYDHEFPPDPPTKYTTGGDPDQTFNSERPDPAPPEANYVHVESDKPEPETVTTVSHTEEVMPDVPSDRMPVRELPDRQPDVNGAPDGKPSPCPFCGGDPYVVEPQYRGASFQIGCDEDDNDCAVNPFVDGDTFDKAVELWNHRAAHTEGEEIERLRIQVADLSKMEEEYREYLQSRSVAQPDNASQGSTDKGKCGFCGEPAVFGFLYDQFGSRYEGWTCKKHHPLITSGERPEQVEAQPKAKPVAWRIRSLEKDAAGTWFYQDKRPHLFTFEDTRCEVQRLYTSPPKVTEEMVERTPDG